MRERDVRDHPERFGRPPDVQRVAGHDPDLTSPGEAVPKACDEGRIELDRDDTAGAVGELVREHAGTGTDLDDEIAARYPGIAIADEVSGEARDEEVLTGPGACQGSGCSR